MEKITAVPIDISMGIYFLEVNLVENSEVVQIKVQLDVSDFSSDIVSAVGAVETAVNNLMYVNIVDING